MGNATKSVQFYVPVTSKIYFSATFTGGAPNCTGICNTGNVSDTGVGLLFSAFSGDTLTCPTETYCTGDHAGGPSGGFYIFTAGTYLAGASINLQSSGTPIPVTATATLTAEAFSGSFQIVPVAAISNPEPSTWATMLGAMAVLLYRRHLKRTNG